MQAEDSKVKALVKPSSGLERFLDAFSRIIEPAVRLASVLSILMVVYMMLVTFVNVMGRAFFDLPIKGYVETVELGMVIMTVFGIGYCALSKKHIRVDVLSAFVSRRTNIIMDSCAYGAAFIFYALISWQGVMNVMTNYKDGITSGVLKVPIFPFNIILVLGALLVSLVFFRDFLKAIYEVRK